MSDGQPAEVRRLAFLELEIHVPYSDLGQYIHTYMVEGHPQRVGYGLEDYSEIPERPKTPQPEVEAGSYEAALWDRYNLYRAILTHERKRIQVDEEYRLACAGHILNTCISEEDRLRVIVPDDYEAIYLQALVPDVGEEDILAVLANTFQGYLAGKTFMALSENAAEIGRALFSDQALGTTVNEGSRANMD